MKRYLLIFILLAFPFIASAQQGSFLILTGGGSKYLKPVGSSWGLMWPGLSTSTTGCLSVASNGWVSASGSICGGSSFGTTSLSATYPIQYNNTVFSLAFGTTTSNTWAGTQTFTNTISGSITGNAGTATALAANGANCSSGNAPLGVDASGAVESCFDVWTEAENTAAAYTPQTRTLTISGTANQISSSAGAQDLSANRTWTLSLAGPHNFTTLSSGQLLYGSGTSPIQTVATSTLTCTGVISCTATTVIGTASTISFSGTLSQSNGGTGASSIGAHMLIANNGSSVLVATSTPTMGAFTATSTEGTATSTINHAAIIQGGIATSTSGAQNKAYLSRFTDIYATSTPGSNVRINFTGAEDTECVFSAAVVTCPKNTAYIKVTIIGSGGGGGGGGSSGNPGNFGGAGNQSCFGTNTTACTSPLAAANGGGAGLWAQVGASGGEGTAGDVLLKGQGGAGLMTTSATNFFDGYSGGASACGGGGGTTGRTTAGGEGAPYGGGGAGGGINNAVGNSFVIGNGGGGAGCAIKLITVVGSTYYYTIGAGGTAGAGSTDGFAGGKGGAGGMVMEVWTY